MKLIADSGSTKTHWCVIEDKKILKEIFTKGINPFYQSKEEIENELRTNLVPFISEYLINEIHFYGAGCAFEEQKKLISHIFQPFYPKASIKVESDLLAAARSLFGYKKGIACILGTGSNSCLYDGEKIVMNVPPLGFILGDEGSGAVLGKKLVADVLKNQLPQELSTNFLSQYHLNIEIILENVYKKPFPNRYLAQFTPFLKENIQHPSIHNIVYTAFNDFFIRNISQYLSKENVPVAFVGSIAFHFSEILKKVASEKQIVISMIRQQPMEGLITYHSEN